MSTERACQCPAPEVASVRHHAFLDSQPWDTVKGKQTPPAPELPACFRECSYWGQWGYLSWEGGITPTFLPSLVAFWPKTGSPIFVLAAAHPKADYILPFLLCHFWHSQEPSLSQQNAPSWQGSTYQRKQIAFSQVKWVELAQHRSYQAWGGHQKERKECMGAGGEMSWGKMEQYLSLSEQVSC